MPIYEYKCSECGLFEQLREITKRVDITLCPTCGGIAHLKMSAPARINIKHNESLPCGNGSEGRYVSSQETGGLPVFIPSWGAMEKEEVDYVAGMAIDKERARVKGKQKSSTKERLEQVAAVARQAPRGERAEAAQEIIKELGG